MRARKRKLRVPTRHEKALSGAGATGQGFLKERRPHASERRTLRLGALG
jgi:hypothetical protein